MLESLGIDWRLLLFQIINFLLLLFILRKVLYKPMLNFLESRRRKIEEGLERAEKFEAEWRRIEAMEKESISATEKSAAKILEKARLAGLAKEKEILDLAQQKSLKILDEAKKEILQAKETAAAELKKEMADLVILATEKILKREIQEKDGKEFIQETFVSLKNK